MIDKNIKLLKPSPLKSKEWWFGDNSHRKAGEENFKKGRKALHDAQDDYKDIDITNPYADAKNAYQNLDNKMANLENVYDQAENVYAGKMQNAYEDQKNAFEDMENPFEDLTVNTQQAEFEAQQNQQMQANIMSQMAGAAGGSGIAALAQSMANQGAIASQKASASIGAQEAANAKKAAEAELSISEQTAQEQSRLDTQANKADMDIQATVLGAEEALQTQKLGEASKLQEMEAREAANLQMREAEGAMEVQEMVMSGEEAAQERELERAESIMENKLAELNVYNSQAQTPVDKGNFGDVLGFAGDLVGAFSDERLKENIIKIKHSHSGIPIYQFNYIGDSVTWSGTMAQDLIKMGITEAVGEKDGYYTVNYNLIDVDMVKQKPSPLKQLNPDSPGNKPQNALQNAQAHSPANKELVRQNEGVAESGMDILAANQRRKNWENLQIEIKESEPYLQQIQKAKDLMLKAKQKELLSSKGLQLAPGIDGLPNQVEYLDSVYDQIKRYQTELYNALHEKNQPREKEINLKMGRLKTSMETLQEKVDNFYEDHFAAESMLSKGNSQQQISFGIQMYCENRNLKIAWASPEDVGAGRMDFYGDIVTEDTQYAMVKDFEGNIVMVSLLDGNRGLFLIDNMKAAEYLQFLKEISDQAKDAAQAKSSMKIPIGKINWKIDSLFGSNDGSSSKSQDELVLQFAHDDAILKDGSSFRRHLYEHPQIEDLNYGGFDFDKMEFNLPLGPGDKNYWHDVLDETDRLRLIDAIVNVDNPFFDINILRTLVKEYYTGRIENAWWKSMGFEEGRLEVMRIKQKYLIQTRFKKEKAEAAKKGLKRFAFDGKVYPTGLTEAKIQQQQKESDNLSKKREEQQKDNLEGNINQ